MRENSGRGGLLLQLIWVRCPRSRGRVSGPAMRSTGANHTRWIRCDRSFDPGEDTCGVPDIEGDRKMSQFDGLAGKADELNQQHGDKIEQGKQGVDERLGDNSQ